MSYRNKGILNHQNGKTLPPSKTPGQPNDEAGAVPDGVVPGPGQRMGAPITPAVEGDHVTAGAQRIAQKLAGIGLPVHQQYPAVVRIADLPDVLNDRLELRFGIPRIPQL